MAINKNVDPETLGDFLKPKSFESKSILKAPNKAQKITVTLDELRPYDHNPRQHENPKYDEIKNSIREVGLSHEPNITKRPGEDLYMIKDGGNTRLQILRELVDEIDQEIKSLIDSGSTDKDLLIELNSKKDSFYRFECNFKPWDEEWNDVDSEIELLSGHMVENEMRGEMLFIDRAHAVVRFRKLFEERDKKPISGRELAAKIAKTGWTGANQSAISQYEYAVSELHEYIPDAFRFGMGFSFVKNIRKHHTAVQSLWENVEAQDKNPNGWEMIWKTALKECDGETFSITQLEDKLENRIAKTLDLTPAAVQAELFRLMNDRHADPADSILNKKSEPTNVTPFQFGKPAAKDTDGNKNNSEAISDNGNKNTLAAKIKRLGQKTEADETEHGAVAVSGSVSGIFDDFSGVEIDQIETLNNDIETLKKDIAERVFHLIDFFEFKKIVVVHEGAPNCNENMKKWFETVPNLGFLTITESFGLTEVDPVRRFFLVKLFSFGQGLGLENNHFDNFTLCSIIDFCGVNNTEDNPYEKNIDFIKSPPIFNWRDIYNLFSTLYPFQNKAIRAFPEQYLMIQQIEMEITRLIMLINTSSKERS